MVRLLFLGIDGLDYEHVKEYECPYLTWLMRGNQHGALLSNDLDGCNDRGEPMTGSAWPSIYTGTPSAIHGLTAARFLKGKSATFAYKGTTIWDILGRDYTLGLTTLAGYAPLSFPLPEINGWAINGFPCAGEVEKRWVYPSDLQVPGWFRVAEHMAAVKPKPANFYELQKRQAYDKLCVALWLPRNDVMAIGLQIIDWVSHCATDRRRVYEFVDAWVRRAMFFFSPSAFVICSDHGFQKDIGRHSQEGVYIVSLPGDEVQRNIYDIAPLTLFCAHRGGNEL